MINIQVENGARAVAFSARRRQRRRLYGVRREGAEPATPLWLNRVGREVHSWPKPSGGLLSRQPRADSRIPMTDWTLVRPQARWD
jgi:hypothetical protein